MRPRSWRYTGHLTAPNLHFAQGFGRIDVAACIFVGCQHTAYRCIGGLRGGGERREGGSAAIVCTHMMLEAAELGIGSCWVGCFNADRVSEVLGLPENVTVSALLPMGYPAGDAKPLPLHAQYRELDDIVSVI